MSHLNKHQRKYLLDSERRVVLEVVPEKWITFDVSKMKADTAIAMAKVAMPEGDARGGAVRNRPRSAYPAHYQHHGDRQAAAISRARQKSV